MRGDSPRHQGQRNRLVHQLMGKGIHATRVLEAIGKVPRHLFMSATFEGHAYDDKPLRIEEDQTISQPYTVALQSQLLNTQPGMRVLEIGTGSGYQAAILSKMGLKVFTIERISKLHRKAQTRFTELGYRTINMRFGDGFLGWPEKAPFDRIIVTAAAPSTPESLLVQLEIGGLLIIPVGEEGAVQRLISYTRESQTDYKKVDCGAVRFVPMLTGTAKGSRFHDGEFL